MVSIYDHSYSNLYDKDFTNEIAHLSTLSLAAHSDHCGPNDLSLAATSNVKINAMQGIQMYINHSNSIQVFTTDADGSNIRPLIAASLSNNNTVLAFSNLVLASSNLAGIGNIVLNDSNHFQLVGTKNPSGFILTDNVRVSSNMLVMDNMTVCKNVAAAGNVFGSTFNLFRLDPNTTRTANLDRVGYSFHINDYNQLELLRTDKLIECSNIVNKVTRVMTFGNTEFRNQEKGNPEDFMIMKDFYTFSDMCGCGSDAAPSNDCLSEPSPGATSNLVTLIHQTLENTQKSVWASNTSIAASNIAYTNRCLMNIASNTAFNALFLSSRTSNVAYSTSNMAYLLSNVAYTASQVAATASNVAFDASNMAAVAVDISGIVYDASNIAYTASNEIGNLINMASYASNISFSLSNLYAVSSNSPSVDFIYTLSTETAQTVANLVSDVYSDRDVLFITSNVAFRTSNVAYPASNVAFKTSNTAYPASNTAYRTSNMAYPASNVAYRASNVAFLTSNIAYATSNVAYATSNVTFITSNMAYMMSNVSYRTSNMAFPSSNVAYATSNIAYATSNVAYTNRTLAQETSNIAYAASTLAQETSNVAYAASTLAQETSNVAYAASTLAQETSNAAFFASNAIQSPHDSWQTSNNVILIRDSNVTELQVNGSIVATNIAQKVATGFITIDNTPTKFLSLDASYLGNFYNLYIGPTTSGEAYFAHAFVFWHESQQSARATVSSTNNNIVISNQSSNLLISTTGQLLNESVSKYPPSSMTSDTTTFTGLDYGNGNYIANASYVYQTNANYAAWKAFDNMINTSWKGEQNAYDSTTGLYSSITAAATAGIAGDWLQIKLPESIMLKSYIVTPTSDGSSLPLSWRFHGSTNGSSWVELDAQTDFNWTEVVATEFSVVPSIPYSYYRLTIEKLNPDGNTANIAQFGVTKKIYYEYPWSLYKM